MSITELSSKIINVDDIIIMPLENDLPKYRSGASATHLPTGLMYTCHNHEGNVGYPECWRRAVDILVEKLVNDGWE
ncbi:hypothetical protein NVP2275O_090 [Vibrio phage 2.275.O._10N.286.54.E11]|nr:hypothetical protein NVP2275O_090 [Vibrio phage 2.275.O._10N.286.54.E11]